QLSVPLLFPFVVVGSINATHCGQCCQACQPGTRTPASASLATHHLGSSSFAASTAYSRPMCPQHSSSGDPSSKMTSTGLPSSSLPTWVIVTSCSAIP